MEVAALEILKKFWKPFLCIVAIGLAAWAIYSRGYSSGRHKADEEWITKYNDQVEASNRKIDGLEREARSAKGTIQGDLSQSLAAMNKSLEQKLGSVKVTSIVQGKQVECVTAASDLHLGIDFSAAWNSINLQATKE